MKYDLYFYISTVHSNVCHVQYGCFLQFLNFMPSWYVAQVLSELI